ncbi:MAG: hypothetical protein EOO61_12430 [Hymenobacter sp.]|nr:MAG: hypothetical protein EOO61_12430 [Hymenobacter sp.]
MNPEDAAFAEEFKPLHVPHKYEPSLSWQDKVVFALADINNGTVEEVAAKLLVSFPVSFVRDGKLTRSLRPLLRDSNSPIDDKTSL